MPSSAFRTLLRSSKQIINILMFVILAGFNQLGFARASRTIQASRSDVQIGTVIKDCRECPELVAIPQVGQDQITPDNNIYVTKFEITWKQYLWAIRDKDCAPLQISSSKNYEWPPQSSYYTIDDDYPLTLVSPNEFKCYIKWLNKKTGKSYRLPSSAEWDHLARAGAKTKYPWGDDLGFDNAAVVERKVQAANIRHYDALRLAAKYHRTGGGALDVSDFRKILQSDEVWPVGSFKANHWGIYDVVGNVEEVTGETSPECSRWNKDSKCPFIVTRGVGYLPPARYRNASFSLLEFRGSAHVDDRSGTVGFRLIRN